MATPAARAAVRRVPAAGNAGKAQTATMREGHPSGERRPGGRREDDRRGERWRRWSRQLRRTALRAR